MQFHAGVFADAGDRLFQRLQADRAPRAGHVGDKIDADRRGGFTHGLDPVGQVMEMRPKRPESSRTRASRPRRAGPGTRAAGRRAITGGRLRSRPSATPCQREPDPAMKLQFPFRSEEHTSELQSLMRITYALFS